jgi:hypothetical protein
MDEHVLPAGFLLDETEAFLAVEELDRALAGSDDLGGHATEAGATAATAWAPASAAATIATAAEAIATAAEPVSAASATVPITAEIIPAAAEAITAAIISEVAWRRESVTATERIESVFAESVALVPAAPTSSIVTHNPVSTLPRCPPSDALAAWTASRTKRKTS